MSKNFLKIRGDNTTLTLNDAAGKFHISETYQLPSWLPNGGGSELTLSEIRGGVEPWLTSLFQSEHLSLLTGAGLSNAIQFLATREGNTAMSEPPLDDIPYAELIKSSATQIAERSNRCQANIEDYIRIINELLRGLEILGYNSTEEEHKNDKENYDKLDMSFRHKTVFSAGTKTKGLPEDSQARALRFNLCRISGF